MSNHFSELESAWKQDKKNIKNSSTALDAVYEKIQVNKKESFFFYYGTIVILTFTLIGISTFFYFVAPVEKLLSRIGVGLMLGGLFIRIIIEVISISKSKKVHVLDRSLEVANNTISFYKYRKNIHGIIAPIIVGFYTVGFYMITPEFLIYLPVWNVVLYDVSYLVMAVFLFIQIRKGVLKEMKTLRETMELRKDLIQGE
tara:strand:- start:13288 stop:13887 length:600 start_codon:yes stop_codon:yes gene_type:complete